MIKHCISFYDSFDDFEETSMVCGFEGVTLTPPPDAILSNSAATSTRDLLFRSFVDLGEGFPGEGIPPGPVFRFRRLLKKFCRTPSPAGLPLT